MDSNIDRQQSAIEKDIGNKHFNNGRYKEAIEHYTKGIQYDPIEPTLLCNRAMAYLKLQEYPKAKIDCDLAITFDSTYVKAYYRRALSYLGMKDYKSARKDFLRVIELEPSNRQALDELKKLDDVTGSSGIYGDQFGTLGTKRALVDITENKTSLIVEPISNPPDEWKTQSMTRITNIMEIPSSSVKDNHVNVTDEVHVSPSCFIQAHSSLPSSSSNGLTTNQNYISVSSTSTPSTPLTSFEFFKYWRSTAPKDKVAFGNYFMNIPPDTYKELFGALIDSDLLADIVISLDHISQNNSNNDLVLRTVLERLLYLSRLERFQLAYLFLSYQEKQVMDGMIKKFTAVNGDNEKDLLENLKRVLTL